MLDRNWLRGLAVLTALHGLVPVSAIDLDIDNQDSLRSVASTIAHGLNDHYQNNKTDTPPEDIGTLSWPYYWWLGGAMWGGLVDYWAYTGDTSYVDNTVQAFVAQAGPNRDLMNPKFFSSTGNDDQAFWALALMSAAEYDFPSPPKDQPQYIDVAKAAFDTQAARWDTAGCGGGLRWQIFDSHPGYNYMNSVSNAAFFQLAARLARYTGESKYVDWAERTYDWMLSRGLIDEFCSVFDGTDPKNGCADLDHHQWSYNNALLIYGSAVLYDVTNGDSKWHDRTACHLEGSSVFFTPFDNATNIMSEVACEPFDTCNLDQQSFKAYMGRWLAKTAILAPFTRDAVSTLLRTSASAAAVSCSGGLDGVTCGTKWYIGGWDGTYGAPQQLAALEVIQSLLADVAGAPHTAETLPEDPPPPAATSESPPPPAVTSEPEPPPPSTVTSASQPPPPAPTSESQLPVPSKTVSSVLPQTTSLTDLLGVPTGIQGGGGLNDGGGDAPGAMQTDTVSPPNGATTTPPDDTGVGQRLRASMLGMLSVAIMVVGLL